MSLTIVNLEDVQERYVKERLDWSWDELQTIRDNDKATTVATKVQNITVFAHP